MGGQVDSKIISCLGGGEGRAAGDGIRGVFRDTVESPLVCSISLHLTKIKGTVQRDFSTPIFFTKRLVLVSIDIPKSDFEFCQIFMELFVLEISKY